MPSIITDDMVKDLCSMSRPIPIGSMGFLSPNNKVGFKPNYIKRGRLGIKPVALPVYAPANVASLIKSTCELSKLDKEVVTEYVENQIAERNPVAADLGVEAFYEADVDYEGEMEYEEPTGSASETPIELFDQDTQTTASELADTKPLRKGKDEEGRVMYTDPSRFESAGSDPVMPKDNERDFGTGNIDVNNVRAGQGGFVGRPRGSGTLRGSGDSQTRRADGEPEL
tara:strand:- start:695 stop:1375 length:681 start_codon:yes stop_codon:yes gene_type:complete